MKLDERLEKSIDSIKDVDYNIDLTKREMIKRPKKRYAIIVILLLLIALILPQVTKTIDFLSSNGNASQTSETSLTTIEDLIRYKNCYRMKWDNDDSKSIKVYYTKKDANFDENNILEIMANIKVKNYSNISDIKIDEDKYEIVFIKLEINAHLIYDVVKNEEINEDAKLEVKLYSQNRLADYSNNDIIISYNKVGKIVHVGDIVNGKCMIGRKFFYGINKIHERLSLNNNYYEVEVDYLNEVYNFYDYYLTHKENVSFNFSYIPLTPKKENSEFYYVINNVDELNKLGYETQELDKYDEEFFKDNMLIIYEKNHDHIYGSYHGDAQISEIYSQRDNLYVVVDTYKSYKLVYSYSRLLVAEINKSDMPSYQKLIGITNYGKLESDITEVSPNNGMMYFIPKEITEEKFSAKSNGTNIIITAEVLHQIEVVNFKRNENTIEIYYKIKNEASGIVNAQYDVPIEFLEGSKTAYKLL